MLETGNRNIRLNYFIKKSNALVQALSPDNLNSSAGCIISKESLDASKPMSVYHYRVYNYSAHQSQANNNAQEIEVNIEDFLEICGLKTNGNLAAAKDALANCKDDAMLVEYSGMMKRVALYDQFEVIEAENKISVRFSEGIMEYIDNRLPNNFTLIPLRPLLSLKKIASMRLYELMKQYWNTATKKRRFDDIDMFARTLFIKQHPKTWHKLIEKFIEPAICEINSKTDIIISCERIRGKRNNQIVGINLTMTPKKHSGTNYLSDEYKEKFWENHYKCIKFSLPDYYTNSECVHIANATVDKALSMTCANGEDGYMDFINMVISEAKKYSADYKDKASQICEAVNQSYS